MVKWALFLCTKWRFKYIGSRLKISFTCQRKGVNFSIHNHTALKHLNVVLSHISFTTSHSLIIYVCESVSLPQMCSRLLKNMYSEFVTDPRAFDSFIGRNTVLGMTIARGKIMVPQLMRVSQIKAPHSMRHWIPIFLQGKCWKTQSFKISVEIGRKLVILTLAPYIFCF